jgi:phosphoribosylanthranilate isomerase
MWIKICANTNLEDARAAADSGADAIGFVFASSPRRVTAEEVAVITAALPGNLKKIGVFGEHSFDEIVFTVRAAGLDGAQLHGGSDPLLAEKLRREFGSELFLIQALHWNVNGDSAAAERDFRDGWRTIARHNSVDAVLLDAKTAAASGGTGTSFDWAPARAVLDEEGGELRVIVAGGLHAGNVAEAVALFSPWGVDVASGTERSPGKKDAKRIREFIAAARVAKRTPSRE